MPVEEESVAAYIWAAKLSVARKMRDGLEIMVPDGH